jgi:hypothetical protein
MADAARQRECPSWTTILGSVRTFAILPDWLAGAIQGEHVRRVLTHHIPEFASGTLILQDCRARHLLLSEDGMGWIGTYYVTVAEPGSEQSHDVRLQGTLIAPDQAVPTASAVTVTFGSDGWRMYVPELRVLLQIQRPDTQLEVLPQLTDPEQARALLEQSIRTQARAYRGQHIESCHPQVLRYHPGLRCTIGYHLTYASDGVARHDWPTFVVAKTYDSEKGQNAYDCMQALWDSPLGTSDTVRIAEPLAYLPELKLLVQGPIPAEQTLQALIGFALQADTPEALDELDDYMYKAATGLAALHSAGVGIGTVHHWEDELAGVRAFVQRLTAAVPDLAAAATPLFTCLESLATLWPPDPPVPTHGTFRPSQVLLDHGRIGVIDFDSFCLAEPAMDLALFRVAIIDMGMSAVRKEEHSGTAMALTHGHMERLAQLESIADRFLAHYAALRPVSRQRVALWEALNILELVVRCWERVKPLRLNHIIMMLERQLRVQSDEGNASERAIGTGQQHAT